MAITFDRVTAINSGHTEGKSFLKRTFDRFVEARTREAQRHINAYLQRQDDETLTKLGYTGAQIGEIRRSDAAVPALI